MITPEVQYAIATWDWLYGRAQKPIPREQYVVIDRFTSRRHSLSGLEPAAKANDKRLSHSPARLPLICAGFTSRLGGGSLFMKPLANGSRFGKLIINLCLGRRGKKNEFYYDATCDCGSKSQPSHCNLQAGRSKSCGCTSWKHGKSKSTTYIVWLSMRQRCENDKHVGFKNYGGRGIAVCGRWKSFENFLADMGERPVGMSIERKNNDGNYEPGNCKWATDIEQHNNQRTNHRLTFNGQTKTTSQWSRDLNLSYVLIKARLRNGWSIERTLTEYPRTKKNQKWRDYMNQREADYAIACWEWMNGRTQKPTPSTFGLDDSVADAICRQTQIEYSTRCRAKSQDESKVMRPVSSEWVENWKP